MSRATSVFKPYGLNYTRLGISQTDGVLGLIGACLQDYIEAIDGVDNGVNRYPPSLTPAYRSKTDISTRVGWLNPRWNVQVSPADVDQIFLKASALVGDEFVDRLDYYSNAWLPARQLVLDALSRATFDGRVIVFDIFAPWKVSTYSLVSYA